MAISGLNRLVIADESGALTGRPLASARAAAEQVATEKVASVKSEAVQAAKDSVQSAVADAIAPVVSTTIPAAVESGVREHAGVVADERIQATVPGMIQSQAATVVDSQLSEKLPTAVQAAAGSEITRQIDERVTPTIEAKVSSVIIEKSASIKDEVVSSVGATVDGKIDSKIESAKPSIVQAAAESVNSALPAKISEGITQAKDSIVSETLGSVDQTIDGKIDAAKTDIARDYNSKIPNIVANTVRELGVGDKNYGFADRNISATSYWWPDFWNENTQKGSEWRKLLNTGSSLGIVVLDKASGEWGDAVDDNFLKQGMLAEAAGAKWCAFYLSSRFGAMAEEADAAYREEVRKNLNVTMDKVERATFDRIVQQAKNIVAWYKGEDKIKKVAIFIDEAPNGWSDSQKKVISWYKRLYLRLKQELGQDVLIVINPGSNTVPEMMDACDVAITYESSASKYIDPGTKFIHPDHYKTMPSWRFWHVIHGVTKDNIDAVFATAEKFNIGQLYATDQKFSVGAGSEDEPEENPYDFAPSDWVIQDTKSWVKGVLPFEQRVSALETVQVVNNRAYSLPEGTDVAGFFLQSGAVHPVGVLWQTAGNVAPSYGLVILVRAGSQVYGYVPGAVAAPNPGNATPAHPAPVVPAPATPVGAPDAPSNLRVAVNGTNLTVTWDTAPDATGYQIAIDGSSPAAAQSGHVFPVQSGQSGIIQVRAVRGDQHSAWTQLGYQVANIPSTENPIQWVFTYAHGGWKDGRSDSGVLREYFYAPGLKTPDGKAKSFEYPVSHKTGKPLEAPNNIKIAGQYLTSPGGIFKKDGAYTLVSWTGEGPKAENSDRENAVWERSALTIAKHGVSTAAKSDGSGREYVLAPGFTYDPRWINNPNQGVEKRDVKPGDKGLEVKREGDLITMSVVRADGSRERIHWFTYNSIKADAGIELYGGTWGEITGTYFEGA